MLPIVLATAIVLAACGGSNDSNDPVAGSATTGSSSDATDTTSDGGDLELDLDDPELEAIIDAELENIAANDEPNPDSPYAGVRIWADGSRAYELLPGNLPHNLAPNEDPFEDPGVRFELTDFVSAQNRDEFVQRVVTDTNWAWVVQSDARISRSNLETGEVDIVIEASDLEPDTMIVSITGDSNAIYVGLNSFSADEWLVELDPATGAERNRMSLGDSAASLYSLTSNANYLALMRDGSAEPLVVVDRGTFSEAFKVEAGSKTQTPLLTTSQLLVVVDSGNVTVNNTMDIYSLPDGNQIETGIDLGGRGVTRAYGDTVIQTDRDRSDDGQLPRAIAGQAEFILDALPDDVIAIYDIHFDDGFIVVLGCCSSDDMIGNTRTFVIDQATGALVLQSTKGSDNHQIAPAP